MTGGILPLLPNLISASRFVFAPFVVRAILAGDDSAALWLCLTAGLTDFADGWLARLLGVVSPFGEKLDPAADKFMLSVIYGTLWIVRSEPASTVVLLRDLIIVLGAFGIWALTRRTSFPPSWPGKISTTLQIGWLVVYFAHWEGGMTIATVVMLVATIVSGLDYIRIGFRMIAEGGRSGPPSGPAT